MNCADHCLRIGSSHTTSRPPELCPLPCIRCCVFPTSLPRSTYTTVMPLPDERLPIVPLSIASECAYPPSAPSGSLPTMRSGSSRRTRPVCDDITSSDPVPLCKPCGPEPVNDGRKCTICRKTDLQQCPINPLKTIVFGNGVRNPKNGKWQANQCFVCTRVFMATMLKIGLCFKYDSPIIVLLHRCRCRLTGKVQASVQDL